MFADAASSSSDRRVAAAAALAGAAIVVFLVIPRATPGLIALLIGALVAAGARIGREDLAARPTWGVALALALAAWGLVSVAWAANTSEALAKVALLSVFALAVGLVARLVPRSGDDALAEIGKAMVIAFAAALVFVLVEELTGHIIKRSVFTLLPFTRPPARHISVSNGEVTAIEGYATNRTMAAISLALWPLLLAAAVALSTGLRRVVMVGLVALAALTVIVSKHETSVLALLAATAVFAATRLSPRVGIAVLAAGWIAATLLVVPLATWAHGRAELHTASWLPHTARQRIILWGYTAQQVPQRSYTGVGIAATKTLDDRRGQQVPTPAGYVYPWRSGPHAHNVFLQMWYELGAVGAGLFCALGLAVIAAIARAARPAQAYLAAGFASASVIGAFTWGLWQPWFLAAFAFSAMLAILAAEAQRRSAD